MFFCLTFLDEFRKTFNHTFQLLNFPRFEEPKIQLKNISFIWSNFSQQRSAVGFGDKFGSFSLQRGLLHWHRHRHISHWPLPHHCRRYQQKVQRRHFQQSFKTFKKMFQLSWFSNFHKEHKLTNNLQMNVLIFVFPVLILSSSESSWV